MKEECCFLPKNGLSEEHLFAPMDKCSYKMDAKGWHCAFQLNHWCDPFFSASKEMSKDRAGIGILSILNIPP